MCVTRPEQVSFIKKLLCDVYYVCLKLETEDYTRLQKKQYLINKREI